MLCWYYIIKGIKHWEIIKKKTIKKTPQALWICNNDIIYIKEVLFLSNFVFTTGLFLLMQSHLHMKCSLQEKIKLNC
jgi:hypothetical protein